MQFELHSPDLLIRATDAREVAEICDHFRLDITKHTDMLIEGRMTHVVLGAKRPWFHLFADVGFEFLQPYYDLLKKVTGYDGPAFEIAAPRYPGNHCVNLCHTHIVADAAISAAGYHAECFIQAGDWNGQPASWHAPRNLAGYLREALGATKQEPEFIEGVAGWVRRNPNYARVRHAPHPACTSTKLFEAIFGHWLEAHATPEQRELWAQGDACYRGVCRDTLASSMLRNYSNDFHINGYKDRVTFEQFQAAGKAVSA
jgi:hypothetical protein